MRFEIDQPLVESGESSRARKQPVKATPSTSVATGLVKNLKEVNLPSSTSKRTTKARQPRKPAVTAQSEVHTAPQPLGTQKKGTKSSAVTAAPAVTPQKRLVIEASRLEHMVDTAKTVSYTHLTLPTKRIV